MDKETAEKIIEVAEQFRRDILIEDERSRTFRDEPYTEDHRENELLCLDDIQSEIRKGLAYSDYEWVESIAETVIEENGLSSKEQDEAAYQFLCRELMKALDRALTVQLERWMGRYAGDEITAYASVSASKAVDEVKANIGRTPAKWDVLSAELRRMAEDNQLELNKSGSINRKQTAKKLREWYAENHRDKAFQKEKPAAADTIVRRLQTVFDELEDALEKENPDKR
jgi:hypothetical protein